MREYFLHKVHNRILEIKLMEPKLIRITTVPTSLKTLLKGQHRFMSSYFEVVGVSSHGKELEEVADDEQIRVAPIDMTRTISPFKDLKSLWQLYRLFKKEKPLIVHTHTPKAGTVGMMAAWLARVPIRLHTIAGLPLLEARGAKRRLLDLVEKITYGCANMIYPNSFGMKDIILENGYTKDDKLKVIANGSSNGIDTAHFDASHYSDAENNKLRENLNIKPEEFLFVFVGRLVGDKGINELINAFKGITDKNAKLLLVGSFENELDPLKKETLSTLETNPSIISVGYQPDVRPYFAISDALAFPSYREGFPNVVMQAGAMGLPSVVTNINGCNEIVEEGVNGLIIPTKDSVALQETMERMMTDKPLYTKLKQNAREMIVSRYEQKVVWEALLEEYRGLIKEYEEK